MVDVCHPKARMQRLLVQRETRVVFGADGRGVDETVGLLRPGLRFLRREPLGPVRTSGFVQVLRQLVGTVGTGVGYRQAWDTGVEERVGDRRFGTASAQLHHVPRRSPRPGPLRPRRPASEG